MEQSIWMQEETTQYPSLQQDIKTDIIIVGAGITGVTLAYYLMQANKDFILVEADRVGYGASGRNTGKITSQHNLIYDYLLHHFDKEVARAYYDANEEAIASIQQIISEHHLACDYKTADSIVYVEDKEDNDLIQAEQNACIQLNIPCEYLSKSTLPIPFASGLRFEKQAQYNPYAYVTQLAEQVSKQGINIFEQTPIQDIQKEDDHYLLLSNSKKIRAKKIVLATQFPFLDDQQFYFTKLFPKQSSILAVAYPMNTSEQLICHQEEVLSYRTMHLAKQDYVLVGGLQHATGRDCSKQKQNRLPSFLSNQTISNVWSSQDYTTPDRLPFIGKLNKDDSSILFAAGFQKWGNTLGCVAAKLLCSMLLDQPSQYTSLFDPHRPGLLLNKETLKENAKTAIAYLHSKMQTPTHVYPEKGHAAIIEFEGKKYGVYKDEQEKVFIVDIRCPHLGCSCVFNEVDKTWDCPCHGSRYSYTGDVIKGPSTYRLATFQEDFFINPHIFIKEK